MYHARPALRFFVALGSFGLAALLPGRERGVPVWLGVGVVMLPFGLFELGAAIAGEATSPRARRFGLGCQLGAALGFVTLFALAMALEPPRSAGAWLGVVLGVSGLLGSAIVLFDFVRLARGLPPVAADPRRAGARLRAHGSSDPARVRLLDALAVIGGTPILVGLIGLSFVGVASYGMLVRPWPPSPKIVVGAVFFGAIVLIAVVQALERWETYVPSSRVRPLRELLQLFAFVGFGGALAAMGIEMLGDANESPAKGVFMLGAGVLAVAGGILYSKRSALASRRGGYELVREGLLERTRKGWFLYPWQGLSSLALGEFQGMPALFVRLAPGAAVELVHGEATLLAESERVLARKRKSLSFSLGAFGADIVVLPVMTTASIGELYRRAEGALSAEVSRTALPSYRQRLEGEARLE